MIKTSRSGRQASVFFLIFEKIYLREREIGLLLQLFMYLLVESCMRPDWESNLQPLRIGKASVFLKLPMSSSVWKLLAHPNPRLSGQPRAQPGLSGKLSFRVLQERREKQNPPPTTRDLHLPPLLLKTLAEYSGDRQTRMGSGWLPFLLTM